MAVRKVSDLAEDVVDEVEAGVAEQELADQIAALRAEVSRLAETVSAIGYGAKAVALKEAEAVTEKVRDKVRDDPISTLLTVCGIAFLLGLFARR